MSYDDTEEREALRGWGRRDLHNQIAMQRTIREFFNEKLYVGGPVHSTPTEGCRAYWSDSDVDALIYDWRAEVTVDGVVKKVWLCEQGSSDSREGLAERELDTTEPLYWKVLCAIQTYASKHNLTVPIEHTSFCTRLCSEDGAEFRAFDDRGVLRKYLPRSLARKLAAGETVLGDESDALTRIKGMQEALQVKKKKLEATPPSAADLAEQKPMSPFKFTTAFALSKKEEFVRCFDFERGLSLGDWWVLQAKSIEGFEYLIGMRYVGSGPGLAEVRTAHVSHGELIPQSRASVPRLLKDLAEWDGGQSPARMEKYLANPNEIQDDKVAWRPIKKARNDMAVSQMTYQDFVKILWTMESGFANGQDYISGYTDEDTGIREPRWRVTLKPGKFEVDKVFYSDRPAVAVQDAEIQVGHNLYSSIIKRAQQFVASTDGRWLASQTSHNGVRHSIAHVNSWESFKAGLRKAGRVSEVLVADSLPETDRHYVYIDALTGGYGDYVLGVFWSADRTAILDLEVVRMDKIEVVDDFLVKNHVIAAWGYLTGNQPATTSYLKTENTKRLQKEVMIPKPDAVMNYLNRAYETGLLTKPAHDMPHEEAKKRAQALLEAGFKLPPHGTTLHILEEPEKVEVRVEDHREGRSFIMNYKVDSSGVEEALQKLHNAIEKTKIQETALMTSTPAPRNDAPIHTGLPMTDKPSTKDKIKNKAKEVGKVIAEETKESGFRAGVDIGFDVAKATALKGIDASPMDPATKAMAHMVLDTPLGQAFLQYFSSVVISQLPIPGVSQEILSAVGHEGRVQAEAKAMKEMMLFAYRYMMTPELTNSLQTIQQLGVPKTKLEAMAAEEAAPASTEPVEDDD